MELCKTYGSKTIIVTEPQYVTAEKRFMEYLLTLFSYFTIRETEAEGGSLGPPRSGYEKESGLVHWGWGPEGGLFYCCYFPVF